MQEKHEFSVLKKKVVEHEQPETPIEVLPSNPILVAVTRVLWTLGIIWAPRI